MKVKLSSEARQDIDHQVAYLTGKTNSGIVTFRNIISRAARLLSDQPYVGQTAAEIPIRGARRALRTRVRSSVLLSARSSRAP